MQLAIIGNLESDCTPGKSVVIPGYRLPRVFFPYEIKRLLLHDYIFVGIELLKYNCNSKCFRHHTKYMDQESVIQTN